MQSSGHIRTGHPSSQNGENPESQGSSQSGCWDIVARPHCWADWNLAEIDLHLARGEGCHQDRIWRLENFRCTENSSSGWQTLEHVAANGAIVVGDISYII